MYDVFKDTGINDLIISDYTLANQIQDLANFTRALTNYTKKPLHDQPTLIEIN